MINYNGRNRNKLKTYSEKFSIKKKVTWFLSSAKFWKFWLVLFQWICNSWFLLWRFSCPNFLCHSNFYSVYTDRKSLPVAVSQPFYKLFCFRLYLVLFNYAFSCADSAVSLRLSKISWCLRVSSLVVVWCDNGNLFNQ